MKLIVQSSGMDDTNTARVMDACLELGLPYDEVGFMLFANKVIGLEKAEEGDIFYGSTNLMEVLYRTQYASGVFYNENFDVRVWAANRDDMLNVPEVMTVGEFLKGTGEVFVRPVGDFKAFDGGTVGDRAAWYDQNSYKGTRFNESELVAVSTPREILAEYRFFIIGGEIFTGSMYRYMGRLSKRNMDASLMHFRLLAEKWLPHENVVMDVAITPEGIKVIEFNCINCSGLYDCDEKKIVKALYSKV